MSARESNIQQQTHRIMIVVVGPQCAHCVSVSGDIQRTEGQLTVSSSHQAIRSQSIRQKGGIRNSVHNQRKVF